MHRIKAAGKIFGGKYYLAPSIVKLFPPRYTYTNYAEDYGGMASVLLAHNPTDKSEIYNDANWDLSNFFDVLSDVVAFKSFQRRVSLMPFSEVQFDSSVAHLALRKGSKVELAAHFFVVCRQSRGGDRTTFATLTKNRLRRQMNEQVSAWLGGIEGLPEIHQRLQRVLVRNCPALELLEEFNNPNTVHYLDPPYHPDTRTGNTEYGIHEMTHEQHEELLGVANKSKSKILLSGYRCMLYDKELAKWNRTDFNVPNNVSSQKTKRIMVESVWRNFS